MIRQIGTTWSASFARHWGNWVSTSDLDTKDHDLQHIPEVDQSGGGGLFLLARHEARIIGTIALRPLGQRICELKRFYLLERFRGTGIGKALLAEVFAHARSDSWDAIRPHTSYKSPAAIELFKRHGFVEIPRWSCGCERH